MFVFHTDQPRQTIYRYGEDEAGFTEEVRAKVEGYRDVAPNHVYIGSEKKTALACLREPRSQWGVFTLLPNREMKTQLAQDILEEHELNPGSGELQRAAQFTRDWQKHDR